MYTKFESFDLLLTIAICLLHEISTWKHFLNAYIDTIYVIFILQRLINLSKINLTIYSNVNWIINTHLTWASKHTIFCSYSRLSNSTSFLCPCSKTITYHPHRIGNILFRNQIKSHSRNIQNPESNSRVL